MRSEHCREGRDGIFLESEEHNITLENKKYRIVVANGILTGFYDKSDPEGANLAAQNGKMGTPCFTIIQDDITVQAHEANTPYDDRKAMYDTIRKEGQWSIVCSDQKNQIETAYILSNDGLIIQCESISAFGLNLDFNFLARKAEITGSKYCPVHRIPRITALFVIA